MRCLLSFFNDVLTAFIRLQQLGGTDSVAAANARAVASAARVEELQARCMIEIEIDTPAC